MVMTATEARSFGTTSTANYALLASELKCLCRPYEDTFTYNRWLAQGYQVMRGEHGHKLPLIKVIETEDKDTGEINRRKLLTGSVVFCRCQVKAINGNTTPGPKAVMVTPEPIKQVSKPVTSSAVPEDNIMAGFRIV